jgi:feruloyl esterase
LSKFNAWDTWLPSADKRDTDVGQSIAREVLRYIAFDNDDPAREIADFDADRDMGNFGLAMRMMDANDTDIRYFQNAGNKLLMYMGWEDLAFSPKALVEYYERLTQTMGKDTDDFARLFMAPGMYHCFGGPGPNKFDYMTPLVTWVEKGIAPETIIAHQYSKEKTVRTHPLCPWPKVAKYKGRGLVEAASSFSCTVPQ